MKEGAGALFEMARSGELTENVLISLQRIVLGFLLGGVPAIVIGIAMGIWRPIRALVDPLIVATYPIPKSSLLPLILLIFGLGEMSKVMMVAIGVLIVGDAGPAFLPVVWIGETLLWAAALLTLVTGYDYLRAGLLHMTQPAPPRHGKPQPLA